MMLKDKVQELIILKDSESADEFYDMNWALNTAEVNKLFLGD
ncbi:MAG: hypothetical protein V3V00_04345 [Saprospiraceae bacterium]